MGAVAIRTAAIPESMPDPLFQMGKAPIRIGVIPSALGGFPERLGGSPRIIGEEPERFPRLP